MSEVLDGASAPAESTNTPIVEGEQQQATPQVEAPTPTDSAAQSPADKKPVDPVQRRIDQITWQKHEAERRYNAAVFREQEMARELEQLRRERAEQQRRASMPTPEQYGMDAEQYRRAMEQHSQQWIEQQQREASERMQAQQQAQMREHAQRAINARIAEAVEKYSDYAEVVGNPALPPLQTVNPPLFAALMEHEQMAELTYYLGKHPSDAHRIASLSPAKAILEMGKIAGRLSAGPARQTSNAPAPPATVGSAATADTGPSDKDDTETWMRKRNEQVRKQAA